MKRRELPSLDEGTTIREGERVGVDPIHIDKYSNIRWIERGYIELAHYLRRGQGSLTDDDITKLRVYHEDLDREARKILGMSTDPTDNAALAVDFACHRLRKILESSEHTEVLSVSVLKGLDEFEGR